MSSGGENDEHDDLAKHAVQFELALVFVMLAFGQLFKHLSHKTKIPYTPMITIFTMLVGIINAYLRKNNKECARFEKELEHGGTGDDEEDPVQNDDSIIEELEEAECHFYNLAFREVMKIDPHLFLFIFLPALIFESAFNTEWHTFKR